MSLAWEYSRISEGLYSRGLTNLCVFSVLYVVTVTGEINKVLALVVQKMDSAIHRINHYPADKYLGNQFRYPLDKDLSDG